MTPRHRELLDLITMHSRTRFEDYPEPERRRWLLRLWLNLEQRDRFTDTYAYYGIAGR